MANQTIAVIFGGRSTEHDVSIITALAGVIPPLSGMDGYEPFPIYIAKDGRWYSEPQLARVDFFQGGEVEAKLKRFKPLNILFDDGLYLVKPGLRPQKQKVDIVFPATHGTYGEDGSLMGLLRIANVPFVGADLGASAVAMDKWLSRLVTSAAGIRNPRFVAFYKSDFATKPADIRRQIKKLKYPLFVKPTHLGSSIAVSKVNNATELEHAIELALHYDSAAIVEEAVGNLIEVTVPILGHNDYELGLVEEILPKNDEFFDFTAKYMHGGKSKGAKTSGQGGGDYSRLPADLSGDLLNQCQDMTRDVFRLIGGSGYARIDLLIDSQAKQVYFNEINPMPGTLQRHNWQAAGVSAEQLVQKLVDAAMARWHDQQSQATTFDSNFLSQF